MSDNYLIRRADALEVAEAEMRRYGFGLPGGRGDQICAAINTIPAVQPTVSPDVAALVEALERISVQPDYRLPRPAEIARATLAEIKGESHE